MKQADVDTSGFQNIVAMLIGVLMINAHGHPTISTESAR